MSKQANRKSYFLKPTESKEGGYDNESETEMQSDSEVTETAADDIVAPAGKKMKCRVFRPEWTDKYPWLRCNIIDGSEKMFCSH